MHLDTVTKFDLILSTLWYKTFLTLFWTSLDKSLFIFHSFLDLIRLNIKVFLSFLLFVPNSRGNIQKLILAIYSTNLCIYVKTLLLSGIFFHNENWKKTVRKLSRLNKLLIANLKSSALKFGFAGKRNIDILMLWVFVRFSAFEKKKLLLIHQLQQKE